jgi:hypothetical protein
LQLSVVAVGLGEALAVAAGAAAARTGEWAVTAALGRVADGAAFAFAAAWGDRLACGRADVGAAARADLIMVDAVESTPMPAWVALLRLPGRLMSAERSAPCEWPLPATRP